MIFNFEDFSKVNEDVKPGSASTFLDFVNRKRIESAAVKKIDTLSISDTGKGENILLKMWNELFKKGEAEKLELDPEITPVAGTVNISKIPTTNKKSAELVIEKLKKYGIVNPNVQKAILSVVGKESEFNPAVSEISYEKTSNSRIRKIFGDRVRDLSDGELNSLKKDPVKFWDRVYGVNDPTGSSQKMGNQKPGDGYRYRGRGFNGITFKNNYKKYTSLLKKNGVSVDLVKNPELLEKPEIAAEVNALYFVDQLSNPESRKKYGNKNPNDFKDFQTAIRAVTNANAGWGKNIEGSEALAKAIDFSRKIDVENLTSLA